MSNFIQRLEVLKNKQAEQIAEKNKLEAMISVKKDALKELKEELQEKGLSYDDISELESEIREREEYLEKKIIKLESSVDNNASLISATQTSPTTQNTTQSEPVAKTLQFEL